MADVVLTYLPGPPKLNVFRDWAGGYGTALPSERDYPGHDQHYFDVPYLQFLFIARLLLEKGITLSYYNLQQQERFSLPEFLHTLQQETPKVLLTSLSLPSLEHDLSLLQVFKERTGCRIVLIGSIAKLFKERILREQYADAIMMGHEELLTSKIIADMLQGIPPQNGVWLWQDGALKGMPSETEMTDLNFVNFPAYELLDFNYYESSYPFGRTMRYATLLTSKGCPYPCSYCPYPIGFGKKVLYRDPELVLADMKKLIHDFKVEFLVFRDQLLTLQRKHCEAIFQGMIREKLPVIWLCETRYDLVDKDLLHLMYQAGCREINYGLESADETLFHAVGKAGAKQGLSYFGQIIQDTKAAGITCHTHLMLGLPGDSWPSIKRTVRFLKTYKPDTVQVAIFIPYPGTPLGDQLEREGVISHANFQEYTGFKAVIPTKHLSVEEINEARGYVYHVWNTSLLTRGIRKLQHWMGKTS